MDFIEGLPKSKGKDTILVVVDRLSEYAHFVSLTLPFTVAIVANKFIENIYKLHRTPVDIMSNRDPISLSNFWKEFLAKLGIQHHLSTTYHPQSDRHTKVLNRCLETYLRCITIHNPNDWAHWLPLAEWWYNTNYHSSIRTNPYKILYGQPPPLHLPYLSGEFTNKVVDKSFVAKEQMLTSLKHSLARAVNRMKQQANKHMSDMQFEVGNWVYLKLQPFQQSTLA